MALGLDNLHFGRPCTADPFGCRSENAVGAWSHWVAAYLGASAVEDFQSDPVDGYRVCGCKDAYIWDNAAVRMRITVTCRAYV